MAKTAWKAIVLLVCMVVAASVISLMNWFTGTPMSRLDIGIVVGIMCGWLIRDAVGKLT